MNKVNAKNRKSSKRADLVPKVPWPAVLKYLNHIKPEQVTILKDLHYQFTKLIEDAAATFDNLGHPCARCGGQMKLTVAAVGVGGLAARFVQCQKCGARRFYEGSGSYVHENKDGKIVPVETPICDRCGAEMVPSVSEEGGLYCEECTAWRRPGTTRSVREDE